MFLYICRLKIKKVRLKVGQKMGILTFSFRVHELIQRRSDVQYKLMQMSRKLTKLQSYAAVVGTGQMSIGALLSAPGDYAGRLMNYMNYAHNGATQYMQMNGPGMMQMYQMNGGQNQPTPQQMEMMQRQVYYSLYTQARSKYAELEQRNLKIEEDKLSQEKEKLQTELAAIEQELTNTKQARDKAIQDMMPKYT